MRKIKFLSIAVIAVSLTMTACTKPKDGEIGPKGDTGATGTAGTNGTDGKNGTNGINGTNGNANVQSFTFYNQNFSYIGTNAYGLTISVLSITQSIMDKGGILVYMQGSTNTSTWAAVPASISGVEINVGFSVGQIKLLSTGNMNTLNIKVVVIAGTNKRDLLEGVDKKDYLAVCKALGLTP